MIRIRNPLPGCCAALLAATLAACISTTTGVPEPQEDQRDAAQLNYELGARYYRQGSFELARQRLETSLDKDPRNATAWTTLALTYEALDNPRLATESYEKAIRTAPRDYNVQNTYAVFLCRQRRFDEAARYFDRAIDARENDRAENTMTNAGVCMLQKPDAVRAEAYFRQALDRRPNHCEALLQMSVLKHATGDNLSARAFLQRYQACGPMSAGMLYLGAEIEGALGDDRARLDYLNRLLREFPDSEEARQVTD